MIRGYSDHAANERTFLAWVRTGIAVIAFGFVIEKLNLFVLTMANANSLDAGRRLQLERLSGPAWPLRRARPHPSRDCLGCGRNHPLCAYRAASRSPANAFRPPCPP